MFVCVCVHICVFGEGEGVPTCVNSACVMARSHKSAYFVLLTLHVQVLTFNCTYVFTGTHAIFCN